MINLTNAQALLLWHIFTVPTVILTIYYIGWELRDRKRNGKSNS